MKATAYAAPNVHEIVLSMLDKKGKLLDIGSGEGALVEKIQKKGFEITACDINPKNFKIKGIKCDKVDVNNKFPYDSEKFDVITCTEVIEHTENPWNLIREANRVLKKNGILILTTPNMENWYSKLLFLFSSKFAHFRNNHDYTVTGHIEPIFSWKINLLLKDKFKIKEVKYNRSIIPLLRINIPIKNKFFGDILILKLERIK